ncbi:polysaccharide pyruvyl transferase family protein [Sphingobacterium phlebotomi]|uniref:Polysaccharide pyruvyl transferase family protein n=1 Tax=Sphingobacterium phlebotomi TaxID=2605433 RepID=A0A5D4H8F9_9SPHI|nr:polysaccharide pyruvyl transferase family protein [Sphingobacterium phlebotomi]TYR36533.1 polysaccharide pyruvyl transferase family protein [Sphingobacterium phlebotomi]
MLHKIKDLLKPLVEKYRVNKQLRSFADPIFVDGFPESRNFGDALNVTLVKYLSGKDVFPSRFLKQTSQKHTTSYAVIGSVCQWSRPQTIVWGAGFIGDKFKTEDFVKPSQVLAVRGPLSRAVYQANGIDCPVCYGDPALLLPLIYNPIIEPVYEYGIIPHYVDWDAKWVDQYRSEKNMLVINIMIGDNHELFVKQLKSCRKIVTSSLHGLILAQAYGIPVCAVKLSDSVAGGEFKFADYLLSVGREPKERINLFEQEVPIGDLSYDSEPIHIDLTPLIGLCPFIQQDQRAYLLSKSRSYYRIEN